MGYFEHVMQIVSRWKRLGFQELENGTKFVGNVPHVGSLAYLHVIFGPLAKNQLALIEEDIGQSLPADLEDFYLHANGCSLFSGSLVFYGHRFSMDRSLDLAARQPISIQYPNVLERPKAAKPDSIFFAAYGDDGSQVFRAADGKVHLCPQHVAEPILYSWPTLEGMISSEVSRLALLFDDVGREFRGHNTYLIGNSGDKPTYHAPGNPRAGERTGRPLDFVRFIARLA